MHVRRPVVRAFSAPLGVTALYRARRPINVVAHVPLGVMAVEAAKTVSARVLAMLVGSLPWVHLPVSRARLGSTRLKLARQHVSPVKLGSSLVLKEVCLPASRARLGSTWLKLAQQHVSTVYLGSSLALKEALKDALIVVLAVEPTLTSPTARSA